MNWRQVSQCEECGIILDRTIRFAHQSFVPVCPDCGARNDGYLFRPRTVRKVGWWKPRWEFHDGEDT